MKELITPLILLLSLQSFNTLPGQNQLSLQNDRIEFKEGTTTKAFLENNNGELRLENLDEADGDLFLNAAGTSYIFADGIAFESETFGIQVNSGDIDLASGADFNFLSKLDPESNAYYPRMKIDNSGKIGFNTFNPQRLLHLSALEGAWQLRLEDVGDYFDIYGGSIFQINDDEEIRFIINGSGSSKPGNIGIGNTSPQRKLHLTTNPSAPQLRLEDPGAYFDLYAGADFLLQNAGGTQFFLKGTGGNAGNVGLGTTNPQRKIHLVTPAAPQVRLQDNGGYVELYGGADFLVRNSSGTNRLVVQGTGPIFASNLSNIGDFRNMQYNDVTGEIGYDNSSRKDKSNIKDLEDNFMALLDIAPKTYTRPWAPDRWEVGFIAEDFHDKGLYPLVEYDQTGRPDGLRYDKMVTYLVPLLKQQQVDLEVQEDRVDQLENEVDLLRRELAAIRKMISGERDNTSGQSSAPQENSTSGDKALLEQNAPNPFSESTSIRYHIPGASEWAALHITDASGKVLKRFTNLDKGPGLTKLQANSLPSGTYFYSLVVDGRVVTTKKMVLTNH